MTDRETRAVDLERLAKRTKRQIARLQSGILTTSEETIIVREAAQSNVDNIVDEALALRAERDALAERVSELEGWGLAGR